MHEVDKVEAVQRQQGKSNKRKRIERTEWWRKQEAEAVCEKRRQTQGLNRWIWNAKFHSRSTVRSRREQATQKLVRRWGVLSANRECEETEKRILRETSFIYGGEFESKWTKTVAKSVVGWCEEQSVNVWNQRRKRSSDFECIDWRRRKLSKESGRKRKERRSRWRIKHRLDLQHKWISGQSDSDEPRRGKNAAMKKEETCFGRKQSWRTDTTAGSRKKRSQTRREVIAAREHRQWVIRNEKSEMRNQSSEGPKQWKIKAEKCGSVEAWKRESTEHKEEQSVGSPERGLQGFQKVRQTASVGRKAGWEPW
jgi:hypothetical protein